MSEHEVHNLFVKKLKIFIGPSFYKSFDTERFRIFSRDWVSYKDKKYMKNKTARRPISKLNRLSIFSQISRKLKSWNIYNRQENSGCYWIDLILNDHWLDYTFSVYTLTITTRLYKFIGWVWVVTVFSFPIGLKSCDV